MPPCLICERSFEFARRIIELSERLAQRGFGALHIARQLIRCGTSIGANAEEAQEGHWELSEANQLLAMIRAAVRTARSSQARGIANVMLLALCSLFLALGF